MMLRWSDGMCTVHCRAINKNKCNEGTRSPVVYRLSYYFIKSLTWEIFSTMMFELVNAGGSLSKKKNTIARLLINGTGLMCGYLIYSSCVIWSVYSSMMYIYLAIWLMVYYFKDVCFFVITCFCNRRFYKRIN